MTEQKASFSDTVKKEICDNKKFARDCCKKSFLYGMLLFSGTYKADAFKLSIKSRDVAKKICLLADELCGVTLSVASGGRNYTVFADEDAAKSLFESMDCSEKETALRLNRAVFDCDMCQVAFVAGAFLVCGMITSPETGYRIEFDTPGKKRAQDLALLLDELISKPSLSFRKSSYVVYYRDSSIIEDLLNLMGAKATIFKLMNTKIEKDMRNYMNRQQNVSIANMKRTIDVAVLQSQAIKKLRDGGVLDKQKEDIIEIAKLREENPSASLTELSELTGGRLCKSYINRRLKKIIELSEKL